MSILSFLFIIVVVIIMIKNSQKNNRAQANRQNPQQNMQHAYQNPQQVTWNRQNAPQNQARVNQNVPQNQARRNQSVPQNQARRNQNVPQNPMYAGRANPQKDILARANVNTQENDRDILESQMACDHVEGGEHSELLHQVENLIVTGYSGDLTFERDFIAEGVEMLNRFEIGG